MQALYQRIKEAKLTKKQKEIAQFFLESGEKIFFLSSKDIASLLQISDTSIIRFVKQIGFDSFRDFREFMKSNIQNKMSSVPQFIENIKFLKHNSVEQSLLQQINESVSSIFEEESLLQIKQILSKIQEAKNKYIVGLKSTAGLAYFFGVRLGFILENVYTYTNNDTVLINSIYNIDKNDLLLLFDYPTYSKEMTLLAKIAKEKGAFLIVISDKIDAPCKEYSSLFYPIKMRGISVFHSFITSQIFVEYLLSLLSKNMGQKETKHFLEIKKILSQK